MSEEFKPGDVVRPAWTHTVAEQANENGHGLFLCADGVRRWVKNYELVEQSIPIRNLREAFLEHIEDPQLWAGVNANSSLMFVSSECNKKLRELFEAITGEPLQKESP